MNIELIRKISTYLMFGLSALFLLVVLTKVGVASFVSRGTSTALAFGQPGQTTSQFCTPGSFQRQCTGQCGGCAPNAGEARVGQCVADGSRFNPIPPTGSECETQCAGPCVVPPPPPPPAQVVPPPASAVNITNTNTNTNTNTSESNSSNSNSNSNTNTVTPSTTCPAGQNLVTTGSGQVVCMPPSVAPPPPPPPPPPPTTIICPSGTTAQTQGSAIVCVSNQTAQTTPATVTIAVAQPASTPQVVQTAGNVAVKELPKTGLPLAGWMLSGLLPVGFKMKKFGRSIKDRFSATDMWEERQYKSTFRD